MRPYHPSNLKLQPYGRKRVIALAWLAKLFGIQFKIDGIPFGAARAVAGLESFGQAIGNVDDRPKRMEPVYYQGFDPGSFNRPS